LVESVLGVRRACDNEGCGHEQQPSPNSVTL
jgi:hypothetical protein